MEATNSLEKFISDYVAVYKPKSGPLSYSEWLNKNGRDSIEKREKINLAAKKLAGADSGYGSLAETLDSLGLSDSGYAKHLEIKKRAALENSLAEAKDGLLSAESDAKDSFLAYLSSNRTATERTFRSAVSTIRSSGMINYDTAYLYAISAGLPSSDARAAASAATEANKQDLKRKISKTIVSKSLTSLQAKEYALSLGFSLEEAEEIAKYADSINSSASVDGIKNYLDELQSSTSTSEN